MKVRTCTLRRNLTHKPTHSATQAISDPSQQSPHLKYRHIQHMRGAANAAGQETADSGASRLLLQRDGRCRQVAGAALGVLHH